MTTRSFLRLFLGLAVSSSVVAFPAIAGAQEWLKDRRFSEGAGVRAGDFEVHPGVGAEIGYDSNWLLRSYRNGFQNSAPTAPEKGAGMLRITPSISIQTLSAARRKDQGEGGAQPMLELRATAAATYREFFGDSELTKQRNVGANLDVRADIAPRRPFGFSLFGGVSRVPRPNTGADPNQAFDSDNLYGGGEFNLAPGGGTFDMHAGYTLNATFFEKASGKPFDNIRHEIAVRNRWRFRPRTALFSETTLGFQNYSNPNGAATVLTNSTPLRTRFGVNGLVGPRVAFLGAVGYGASFYALGAKTTQQYDSVIGQGELRFYLTDNPDTSELGKVSLTQSSLTIGYTRDFQNSFLGDVYGVDKGYGSLAYFFGARVLTSASVAVSNLSFKNVYLSDGSVAASAFNVVRPEVTLYGEYRFTDTIAMNLTANYSQNVTTQSIKYPEGNFDLAWRRAQVFLGGRFFL